MVMVTHTRQLVAFGTRHVEMTEGALCENDDHTRTAGVVSGAAPGA